MIQDYIKKLNEKLAAGDATEHTHRSTLEALVQSFDKALQISNEPKRIKVGAPDLVVRKKISKGELLPVGYIETKDIGEDLNKIEKSEQLVRYLQLPNLILTDYLEFRWYVNGERRQTVTLGSVVKKKVKLEKDGEEKLRELFESFLAQNVTDINSPKELAARMAGLCKNIDRIITETFAAGEASELMQDLKSAFERTLLPDITDAQFADMFAQTLGYGLFAARINHYQTPPSPPVNGGGKSAAKKATPPSPDANQTPPNPDANQTPPNPDANQTPPNPDANQTPPNPPVNGGGSEFTRTGAAREIPKSNPFLRNLFDTIHSADLEDEAFIGFVDDLTAVLAHTDMAAVLAQFGKRTKQEDPILHFYETFLSEYDPKERKRRGVYYTPEPVVSYIVRSVDILLKEKFGLKDGLADTSTIEVEVKEGDKFVKRKLPKVLILDPACGTGTFLYAVVDLIRSRFMEQNRAGEWRSFVSEHLIPRIYGFELQMAPYAVAHLKLAMQLAGHDLTEAQRKKWGYEFTKDERLNVYLTNSLEYTEEKIQMEFGFIERAIAEEARAAQAIKGELPIMVVMGNPPYSNFGRMNQGRWILDLLKDYKSPKKEKKSNDREDYIKFIRFAHWRLERSGAGILAFITGNSYLDGATRRGMRGIIVGDFSTIDVLDLAGSMLRKEELTEVGDDKNVFDIGVGVSISIFVKQMINAGSAKARYAKLIGPRANKYDYLLANDVSTTKWKTITPRGPEFLLVDANLDGQDSYDLLRSVREIFPTSQSGIQTDRDELFVDFDKQVLTDRMRVFYSNKGLETEFVEQYRIYNSSGYDLLDKRKSSVFDQKHVIKCFYRVLDNRYAYYSQGLTSRPAWEVMKHMVGGANVALVTSRQQSQTGQWRLIGVTDSVAERCCISNKTREANYLFPLYLYPSDGGKRKPNLDAKFVAEFAGKLGLEFVEEGTFWTPIPGPSPVNGGRESESPSAYGVKRISPSVYGGVRGGLKKLSWEDIPKSHWQFAREMRKEPTAAEKKMWQALKTDKLGVTFRRQHPIGPFIVDFLCNKLGIVLEVDGDSHYTDEAKEYDRTRDKLMREVGLVVLRYTNNDVLKNLDGVISDITKRISVLEETPPNNTLEETPPNPPVNGGGSEFGPEDVFYYIYAVFHSPTYRERYKEFLKIDFPRVPLTSNREMFGKLVALGHELTKYHLLEHAALNDTPVRFPEPGDNVVAKVRYDETKARVFINDEQYFEKVPQEVWEFHVGGYQVCQKWLKDRGPKDKKPGRTLSHDDIKHYEKVVMALGETIRLMKGVDAAIPRWPIE